VTAFLRAFQRSEWGLLLAIAVVLVLTTVLDTQHTYWTYPWPSVVDILRQTSLLGIFTLGAAIVIISGGIDLSSGSVIAFSGSICATIIVLLAPGALRSSSQPLGLWVIGTAIAGTILVGFLIGSLHAWLITVIRLPPFIATLATLVGLRSFARVIVENVTDAYGVKSTQIQIFDDRFRYLATSVWIPVLLFALFGLLAWILMSRTVVGRHLHALGGNEQAARLSGIQTDRLKWLAYCLSAMLSSVAGILYICDQSIADPQTLGRGYELNGIAAAVVGGCSLQGGVGTVPGAFLGALFLRVVIDGVAKIIKTGADVYEGLIVGSVVVVAVTLTRLRQVGQQERHFLGGALGLVTAGNVALLAGVLAVLFGQKAAAKIGFGPWPLGISSAVVTLALLLAIRYFEARARRRKIAQPESADKSPAKLP
jgi:ribose/xylose/arabinose/galactoside ABC-type transport system permease subunit